MSDTKKPDYYANLLDLLSGSIREGNEQVLLFDSESDPDDSAVETIIIKTRFSGQ